jgi:hypothetical protein
MNKEPVMHRTLRNHPLTLFLRKPDDWNGSEAVASVGSAFGHFRSYGVTAQFSGNRTLDSDKRCDAACCTLSGTARRGL